VTMALAVTATAGCVTGSGDPEDASVDVSGEVISDGSGDAALPDAVVDAAADADADADAVEDTSPETAVPDATTDPGGDGTADPGGDGDAGCAGCIDSDGVCRAIGESCADDDDEPCKVPVCLPNNGDPQCNGSADIADETPCGPPGCDGVCQSGACDYPDVSGCGGLNLTFVTRDTTSLDVGGPAGFDQFCAEQAALNAALPQTEWKAWVGVAGANITAASRLGDAVAFIRVDGNPVAQTPQQIAAGELLYPPLLDQFGDPLTDQRIATGMLDDGTPGDDCVGWNAAQGMVTSGWAAAGTGRLNESETVDCGQSLRILCLQVAHTDGQIVPPTIDGRLAFVSDGVFDPATGAAAADALCQSEAEAAAQSPGIYRAYIATGATSPSQGFADDGTAWRRHDGLQVLTHPPEGPPTVGIAQTAAGNWVAADVTLWMGTQDATATGGACSDWSDGSGQDVRVAAGIAGSTWLELVEDEVSCAEPAPVLCLQASVVDDSGCSASECVVVLASGSVECIPNGQAPAAGGCLVCDTSVSRFVLQPSDTVCEVGPCTVGTCLASGVCEAAPAQVGVMCDDDDPCTDNDSCDNGGNCIGSPKVCSSGNLGQCEEDACDATDGACIVQPVAIDTPCDDGDVCTDSDVCSAGGTCAGQPINGCTECTIDGDCTPSICQVASCSSGACVYTDAPDGAACNEDLCLQGMSCNGSGQCGNGTPIDCDDGNPCTIDACDAQNGNCVSVAVADDTLCDDGNACTAASTCQAGQCESQGASSCGKRIFVSSVVYGGAGDTTFAGLAGPQGADAECQQMADAAELGGTFVALLSDTSTNAYERLGDAPGGYENTAGLPVAPDKDALLGGRLWHPVGFDENVVPADPFEVVATGTGGGGNLAFNHCQNWSAFVSGAFAQAGFADAGNLRFIGFDSANCNETFRIYCVETSAAAPVSVATTVGHRLMTFLEWPYDLTDGVAQADAQCQARANAEPAYPGGAYRALLNSNEASALARVIRDATPWVRQDGMLVIDDPSSLPSPLISPITLRPDGNHVQGATVVTGGTLEQPDSAGTCGNWSGPGDPAAIGIGRTYDGWFDDGFVPFGDINEFCPEVRTICVQEAVNVVFALPVSSGALGGINGASGSCQAAAQAAGLTGTFSALLGQTGSGLFDALGVANGFVRPDGKPIAANANDLVTGAHWYPPTLQADGNPAPQSPVFTGSGNNGVATGDDCSGWSSAIGVATTGRLGAVGAAWVNDAPANCSDPGLVMCVQTDHDTTAHPPAPVPSDGRHAFVSSPNFIPGSGIASADALCQAEAIASGLPSGRYKAALATSTSSIADRFDATGGAWYDAVGIQVTASGDLSAATTLEAPLIRQADGAVVFGGSPIVTGTTDPGVPSDPGIPNCDDWTNPFGQAQATEPGTVQNWLSTETNYEPCDEGRRVICLQDTRANYAFVTSNTFGGAEVGGITGADDECQQEAEGAGMVGTYRAYLSTSTVNAIDRIGGGRGWIRPDGLPVADTAADFASGRIFHPPRLHADASKSDPDTAVWTGSAPGGVVMGANHCTNWTAGGDGAVGFSDAGGYNFVNGVVSNCNGAERYLLCMGVDQDAPVVPTPKPGRLAFVSTASFDPSSGLAGADALCTSDAVAAGLPGGSYKALLATDAESAQSRFDSAGPTWVRPDGVPIVAQPGDLFGLTTDKLAGISLRADGSVSTSTVVWTGANNIDSTGFGTNCSGWTSNSGDGAFAFTSRTGSGTFWHQFDTANCAIDVYPVYCLQDTQMNYMFTTSASYDGNLGGLDGADAECQAAADGKLPGTYVAWMSDGSQTAYDRIAATGAQGWIRPDGQLVAESLDDLDQERIAYPPSVDENGATAPQGTFVWSGTLSDGFAAPNNHCQNWTSADGADTGLAGYARANSGWFTEGISSGCDVPQSLRCLQVDFTHVSSMPPDPPDGGRMAFVSSQGFALDAGLAGADALCQQDAEANELPIGQYLAVLPTTAASAASRFATDGIIRRVDGVPIASASDFFNSTSGVGQPLPVPLNLDAAGNGLAVSHTNLIATGGTSLTSPGLLTCNDWSSTSAGGLNRGIPGLSQTSWLSSGGSAACDTALHRVYCLQAHDANIVFTTRDPVVIGSDDNAGEMDSLADADQICQQRAGAAGLTGFYMAWLSDQSEGAFSRLDLTGASGWMRTDGRPVASTAFDWADGRLYYPPMLDEYGDPVAEDVRVWSGTQLGGTPFGASCGGNWSSTSGTAVVGLAHSSGASFTYFTDGACSSPSIHLRCLQVDRATSVTPPTAPPNARYAFISSQVFSLDSGVSAADAICQADANGSSEVPAGTYKALLGTSGTPPLDASRFDLSGGPWVNLDGIPLSVTAADFADPGVQPLASINTAASGAVVPAVGSNDYPVTSRVLDGTGSETCGDWGTTSGTMGRSRPGSTTSDWYEGAQVGCVATPARVFCLQE